MVLLEVKLRCYSVSPCYPVAETRGVSSSASRQSYTVESELLAATYFQGRRAFRTARYIT